ncbi:MAG: hypothetical protein ABII68_04190 [Pseudomonadota bacterium]
MARLFFILLGVVWGLFGILIIINPAFYHSELRYHFDFTEIKWPFGGGLIILGCFFIWSSFRKKVIDAEKRERDEKRVLMCPRCIKPFYKKDAPALKCPDCQNYLEDLSGFYERHPELKQLGEK